MEQYIIFAFISMFFFGLNAIVLKTSKNIDPVILTIISLITALILAVIFYFFFYSKKEFSVQGLWIGLVSGAIYMVSYLLFIIALKQGKVSVVSTINALSAGVAVILAVTLLSEKLTAIKVIGIILGIIAAILLSI